jgi:hypothetical protein
MKANYYFCKYQTWFYDGLNIAISDFGVIFKPGFLKQKYP